MIFEKKFFLGDAGGGQEKNFGTHGEKNFLAPFSNHHPPTHPVLQIFSTRSSAQMSHPPLFCLFLPLQYETPDDACCKHGNMNKIRQYCFNKNMVTKGYKSYFPSNNMTYYRVGKGKNAVGNCLNNKHLFHLFKFVHRVRGKILSPC